MSRQRCAGIRKDGSACTNWAIGDTGYCRHHQPGKANAAQPPTPPDLPPFGIQLTVDGPDAVAQVLESMGVRKGSQDMISLCYAITAEEAHAAGWDARQHVPPKLNSDGTLQFAASSDDGTWYLYHVIPSALVKVDAPVETLGIGGSRGLVTFTPQDGLNRSTGEALCPVRNPVYLDGSSSQTHVATFTEFMELVRQRQEEIIASQAMQETIHEEDAEVKTTPIRDDLSFLTFAELGAIRDATYDMARGMLNTQQLEGEVGVAHHRPGARHSVKAVPSPLLSFWGKPLTQDAMEWAITQFGEKATDAIKTLYVATGMALAEERGSVLVNLNDFLPKIGLEPKSTAERQRLLRDLFLWFTVWDGFSVYGKRSGERYVNPKTGELMDTTIDDPLFRIMGKRYGQRSFDNSEPPLAIYISPGAFLQRFRGMRQVLQDFGELLTLTQIKSGKPSGEWAYCIGSSLRQLWRQRAKDATVITVGEDKHATVRGMIFNRRQLFTLYPPTKNPVEKYLNDPKHAQDARKYWDDAIRELRQLGEVGYYQEKTQLPTEPGRNGKPRLREGWQDAWLDQELDIRPARDQMEAVAEINRKAITAQKSRSKRKK